MNKVRVGLAGLGTIANVMHQPGLNTMEEMGKVELVCGCDINEAMALVTGEKFGVKTIYTDLDTMLAKEEFDLLVNLTRIPDHFVVSLTALKAGRHVYTQKPMTTSVEEATMPIAGCDFMTLSRPASLGRWRSPRSGARTSARRRRRCRATRPGSTSPDPRRYSTSGSTG